MVEGVQEKLAVCNINRIYEGSARETLKPWHDDASAIMRLDLARDSLLETERVAARIRLSKGTTSSILTCKR